MKKWIPWMAAVSVLILFWGCVFGVIYKFGERKGIEEAGQR